MSDTLLTTNEPTSSVIAIGLQGEKLTGEWNEWLSTLREYVLSVHTQRGIAPRRVVITSGRWLVIFIDPDNSFLASSGADPSKILVFEIEEKDAGKRDLIEEYYN
jgi:hypothetical protein